MTTVVSGEKHIVPCALDKSTGELIEYRTFDEREKELKEIADIERQIEETRQTLAELALQLARKVFTMEIYTIASKQEEEKLAKLRETLSELQAGDKSSAKAIQHIEDCMEQIKTVLDLSDEDINEGLYERITKKIVVHPNKILEFHLSFMPIPIYLQYRASGKGDFYKVEFDIIQAEKVAEMVSNALTDIEE